jgi:dTDP-4-amino-4,6-dideoxygalactose transaminase
VKVEFYRHSLGQAEREAVTTVLDSVFLGGGPKTDLFEEQFSAYMQNAACAGLNSCTAGMFLALKAWGIGAGDKVVVPAMTFVATPNAVLHCGADAVFADVDRATCLIDPDYVDMLLKKDKKIKVIMPVHLYGQMADMKALRQIADKRGVRILEDSAHCVEGERDGIKPGALGDVAAFSFYATKNLSSGEGGAVVSRDTQLIRQIKVLRRQGMNTSPLERHVEYTHWNMEVLGYKASMCDIQAALLLMQIGRVEALLQKREQIAQKYEVAFDRAHVRFPKVAPHVKHARHLFTIWSPPEKRDENIIYLQRQGIGVTVNYNPPHLMNFYKKTYGYERGFMPQAEWIGERTITIPLYPSLTDEEIEYVIHHVIACCQDDACS